MVALMDYKDALAHVPAGEAQSKRKKLAEDMQVSGEGAGQDTSASLFLSASFPIAILQHFKSD